MCGVLLLAIPESWEFLQATESRQHGWHAEGVANAFHMGKAVLLQQLLSSLQKSQRHGIG